MANLDDILGKKKDSSNIVEVEIDGMCGYFDNGDFCYFSLEKLLIDEKNKLVTAVCIKGHETKMSWDLIENG